MRRSFVVLAAFVAVLALGTATAVAHTVRSSSTVTIEDTDLSGGQLEITGHVNSPRASCRSGRVVTAWAVDTNGTASPSDDDFTFIGSDVTGVNGGFVIRGEYDDAENEIILVRVHRRETGGEGHRHICQADTDTEFE